MQGSLELLSVRVDPAGGPVRCQSLTLVDDVARSENMQNALDATSSSVAASPSSSVRSDVVENIVDRFRRRDRQESPRKLSKMELEVLKEKWRNVHMQALKTRLQEAAINAGTSPVFSQALFIATITDEETIPHLFALFDWEGSGYLHHDQWIEFLKGRISTSLQRELIEVVETAAYLVVGNDVVTADHFRSIINARGVARKLFRAIHELTENQVTIGAIMDFISRLSNSRPNTGFTKENLEWLERLFRVQVGNAQELSMEDFKKIVHSKNVFFAERVFQIFDRDNSGSVSLQEFMDAVHRFAGQSHEDKIQFLFRVYDLDGDGLIQHRELQHVIHACMDENGMQFSDEQIEDLTWALFEDADLEGRGAITYEALKAQLEKHDGLLENLSTSIERWLVPVKPKTESSGFWKRLSSLKPYQFSLPYLKNNYVYLTFLFMFLAVNVGLFVSRAFQFRDTNVFYIVARACGQCLNFNCAFVLAVMLRNTVTFARTHGLGSFIPLDEHIYFHKMSGWFIFVYSVLHTVAHFFNFALNVVPANQPGELNAGNFSYAEWLLTMRPRRFGLIPGIANPSGIILIAILTVIVICSQPFVRKRGNFEIFYRTHLLYVPFFILTLVHGPHYWKWLVVPGLIYLVERVLRLVRTRAGRGKTYISSGILLPSKVTHLVIRRPSSMDFHPGDYVFVNIPAIAKYEWHPFTISSAPEQDDTLWLHIRALGGWTNRLYDYFEEQQMRLECIDEARNGDGVISDTCQRVLKHDVSSRSKIHKSIRKMAGSSVGKKRRISFGSDSGRERVVDGSTNEGFTEDGEVAMTPIGEETPPGSNGSALGRQRKTGLTATHSEDHISVSRKAPLLKTISLPDMEHRVKRRQKQMILRGAARSTSEHVFDTEAMRQARSQANNLPYLRSPWSKNPKNKSLAKSFRYMRRKPTIIAFKTPSSDSLELEKPAERVVATPEAALEEGRGDSLPDEEKPDKSYPVVGKPLEIFLDGPYGAPSSHMFRAQHAVLIGTGIGVTPFASILQSIMHRYWKNRHRCPNCSHEWTGELPESVMNLRKVDFFWINRDQRSFEWFVNLLSQLEIEQAELGGVMDRFLDMHMYITSALQKTDMKAVGLQLALDLLHEKEKRDMITGLKTRTIAGRPNWNKVFRQIQEQRKGKVTVFFCGPPQLSRVLRYKCDEFGFKFRKENF